MATPPRGTVNKPIENLQQGNPNAEERLWEPIHD
jgi:hypothetical protein